MLPSKNIRAKALVDIATLLRFTVNMFTQVHTCKSVIHLSRWYLATLDIMDQFMCNLVSCKVQDACVHFAVTVNFQEITKVLFSNTANSEVVIILCSNFKVFEMKVNCSDLMIHTSKNILITIKIAPH